MELQRSTVAVTGATGFLGRYIVEALLARGARVVGVVRNPERVPALRDRGVELRKADLADREALTTAFAGCDAVVSNAALFSIGNQSWDEHLRTNVQGTSNVFDAMAAASVRRVVHVSSIAVYRRPFVARTAMDEDAPMWSEDSRRLPGLAYSVSKAVSERRAWELSTRHDLALTTVRPSVIYGAFDPNWTRRFKAWFSWPLVPVPVMAKIPLVYAADVAHAIAASLERDVSIGRAYNTAGDAARSWWEFARAWSEVSGRPVRRVPWIFPLRWPIDNGRAERDLGFGNRPFAEGLRETFAREYGSNR